MKHSNSIHFAAFFLVAMIFTANSVFSQPSSPSSEEFHNSSDSQSFLLDALCFRNGSDTLQRVDIFTAVPYQSLQFIKNNEIFGTEYKLSIKVRDSSGKIISESSKQRPIVERSREATYSAGGQADYTQTRVFLPDGIYTIEAFVTDMISHRDISLTHKLAVPNFRKFPLSLSSLMLADAIAQNGTRFSVTPRVIDDISNVLADGFFVFFESYNVGKAQDSVDFYYEIANPKDSVILHSNNVRRSVKAESTQQFLKIKAEGLRPGKYTLHVFATKTDTTAGNSTSILAATERSIRVEWNANISLLSDEEFTIKLRQMRYVATQSEMDSIGSLPTFNDKRQALAEFWKNLDPTPGTPRNEAYEEYYERIEYANKNFRSYTDGWITDMGMVYVIYGAPMNRDKQIYRTDGRTMEVWSYGSRRFTFMDNSGFNDYRLITPLAFGEKYRYGR